MKLQFCLHTVKRHKRQHKRHHQDIRKHQQNGKQRAASCNAGETFETGNLRSIAEIGGSLRARDSRTLKENQCAEGINISRIDKVNNFSAWQVRSKSKVGALYISGISGSRLQVLSLPTPQRGGRLEHPNCILRGTNSSPDCAASTCRPPYAARLRWVASNPFQMNLALPSESQNQEAVRLAERNVVMPALLHRLIEEVVVEV
jgi:hypothetical protein